MRVLAILTVAVLVIIILLPQAISVGKQLEKFLDSMFSSEDKDSKDAGTTRKK